MLKGVGDAEVKQCLGGLQGDTWFLTEDGLYEDIKKLNIRREIARRSKNVK